MDLYNEVPIQVIPPKVKGQKKVIPFKAFMVTAQNKFGETESVVVRAQTKEKATAFFYKDYPYLLKYEVVEIQEI